MYAVVTVEYLRVRMGTFGQSGMMQSQDGLFVYYFHFILQLKLCFSPHSTSISWPQGPLFPAEESLPWCSSTCVFLAYISTHTWGQRANNKRQFVEGDISTWTSLKLVPSWVKARVVLPLKPLVQIKLARKCLSDTDDIRLKRKETTRCPR